MDDYEKIELRSEKMRNIIGKIPSSLVRSGISFVAFIVIGLLLAAWFIPYPENLRLPVEITSSHERDIQAKAYIPYSYVSRLTTEIPVEMEMEGYNARNYGYIRGFISNINKDVISREGQNCFTVTIQLNPANTKIEIKEQMTGQAFILLSNKSILKHLFAF